MSELILRDLRVEDEASFRRAVAAFRLDRRGWDFAFRFDDSLPFAAYVALVHAWARGDELNGWVPHTYLVAVVGDEVVGRVSLRHELTDQLRQIGGHVGYDVVPAQRRKGYATEMLRLTIPLARARGIDELLLTCDEDNIASRRTIEHNGGRLVKVIPRSDGAAKCHYLIATAAPTG